MKLKINSLTAKQREIAKGIIDGGALYNVIVTSRQVGKTYLAKKLLLYFALKETCDIMFTSPIYSQSNRVMKEIIKEVGDSGLIVSKNYAENSVQFINGSEVFFKSVERADNLRGYTLDYLFCDEAAFYADDVFSEVLRPFVLVKGKKVVVMSTPKGKNWFFDLSNMCKTSDRYKTFYANYTDNPFADIREVEDAKRTMNKSIFRQEYLGEFIEDGGEVFSNVEEVCIENVWPTKKGRCFCGIDIGRQNDYTVATFIDESGRVIYIYRANKKEFGTIIDEVSSLLKKYVPVSTFVETNGIGDFFFDALKQKYNNITAWTTSNTSKQHIIERLIADMQSNCVFLPSKKLFPPLTDELLNFSFRYSPQTRQVIYAARGNGHDDTVMSLALANYAKAKKTKYGQVYVV